MENEVNGLGFQPKQIIFFGSTGAIDIEQYLFIKDRQLVIPNGINFSKGTTTGNVGLSSFETDGYTLKTVKIGNK